MHTTYSPVNSVEVVGGSGEEVQAREHPSRVLRANEAVRKGIGRRICVMIQRKRTENRGEGHVLPKELRSNTREANAEGDARNTTKKTKTDASKQK